MVLNIKYTLLNYLLRVFHLLFRVRNNRILFNSFDGRSYSDNPRCISEELYRLYNNSFEYIWVINGDNERKVIPFYVKVVKTRTLKYFYYVCTSKIWIYNFSLPIWFFKSSSQYYIQTWHGDCPFKKIMLDDNPSLDLFETKSCDLMVAGSKFGEKIICSSFDYHGEFSRVGCPRNDLFFNDDTSLKNKVRDYYCIPSEANILLYAPTFRNKSIHGIQHVELNLEEIKKTLEKETNNKWYILVRSHAANESGELDINNDQFINVSAYPEMNELLLITDILITDYSSCAGDFALSGKMILLFQNDIAEYSKEDRELYFDMNESPFFTFESTDEINEFLKNYKGIDTNNNCQQILEFYGSFESGKASASLAELVYRKCNE